MKVLKITLLILSVFSILIFTQSCGSKSSSPILNEVISVDNIVTIAEKAKNDQNLTQEEIDLFANGLAALSMSKNDSLFGKTVADVIEYQKKAQKESSISGLLTAATRAEMNLSHKFQLLQFSRLDSGDNKTNVITFRISNLTDKPIKNIQGYLNIFSENNQLIKKFPINIMKKLDPHSSSELQTPPYKHVDANPNDTLIRTKGTILKPMWQPIIVEYDGGKKLGPVR